jgi:ABC-type xylose transport system permease subunit
MKKATKNKRFKITIVAFILMTIIACLSMVIKVEESSVVMGVVVGIQMVASAFIGGDSYRKSESSEYSESTTIE